VLGVGLEARQSSSDDVVGHPLHGLSGDAEPSGHLRDGEGTVDNDAQQLPAGLGLPLAGSQRLPLSPESSRRLVDIRHEEGDVIIAPFDNLLSNRHRLVILRAGTKPVNGTKEELMSTAIDNLQAAQRHASAIRPKIGGFPVLAETLRRAGVRRNIWSLPSTQSLYLTDHGPVVDQGAPLVTGIADVAAFDQAGLVRAIRSDQAGETTLAQFLEATWRAGVVRYECDFDARTVTYYGANDETYVEAYPTVDL
jgi:uncharacterized protein YbcV (DUF1398 family)